MPCTRCSVQNTHAEGGMVMSNVGSVPVFILSDVDMEVLVSLFLRVLMGVTMNGNTGRHPKGPEPHSDQQQTHDEFGPLAESCNIDPFSSEQTHGSEGQDSQAMTQSPENAQAHRTPRLVSRQRRQRRDVIRSRHHVKRACQ